jgi:hypothetical protein
MGPAKLRITNINALMHTKNRIPYIPTISDNEIFTH